MIRFNLLAFDKTEQHMYCHLSYFNQRLMNCGQRWGHLDAVRHVVEAKQALFRLTFYLPVMLPPIVTAFLWLWIYDADNGLLNTFLHLVHLPGGLWLENEVTALPALVVVAT